VWPIEAADSEVVQTYGYLTDILPAYNEAEQRVALRTFPIETIEFAVLEQGRPAQLLHSLVYGLQDEQFAVPLWQYGQPLTTNLAIGGHTANIADGVNVPFERQLTSYALVWLDAFNWQVFTIIIVASNFVFLFEASARLWLAGQTKIYPMRLARISEPELRWLDSPPTAEGRIAFTCEANFQ
jgi:hypothetical protein